MINHPDYSLLGLVAGEPVNWNNRCEMTWHRALRKAFQVSFALLLVAIPAALLTSPLAAPTAHDGAAVHDLRSLALSPAKASAPSAGDLRSGPFGPAPRAGTPVAHLPITIVNNQGSPTPQPFQQNLSVDSHLWSAYINANWSNVGFQYANGTNIPAWIEANATNTATDTPVWLKLNQIPAGGSVTINMNLYASTSYLLSAAGPIGEAPSLSSARYGAVDDGRQVFNFYDNFAGTSLDSQWTVGSGGIVTVNNGVTAGPGNCFAASFSSSSYQMSTGVIDFNASISAAGATGTCTMAAIGLSLPSNPNADRALVGDFNDKIGVYYGVCATNSATAGSTTTEPLSLFGAYHVYSVGLPPTLPPVTGQVDYRYPVSVTNATYMPTLPQPLTFIDQTSTGISVNDQWIRTRAYPPNGVVPTVSYGSLVGNFSAPTPSAAFLDADQAMTVTDTLPTNGSAPSYSYQWLDSQGGGPFGVATMCGASASGTGAPGAKVTCSIPAATLTPSSYVFELLATPTGGGGSLTSPPSPTVQVNTALAAASPPVPNATSLSVNQPLAVTDAMPSSGTPTYQYEWLVSLNGSAYSKALPCALSSGAGLGKGAAVTCDVAGGTLKANSSYTFELGVNDSATVPESRVSSPSATVTTGLPLAAGVPTPSHPILDLGQSVVFTSAPSGGFPPYAYQWYGGTSSTCSTDPALAGATGSQYTAQPAASGFYCYSVTDNASHPVTVRSPITAVTVNPPLLASNITPSAPTLAPGQNVTLTSHATGGTPTIAIQWLAGSSSNCSLDTPIGGATSATLNAAPSTSTYYCYRLTDQSSGTPAARALSATDLVTVSVPPGVPVITSFGVSPASVGIGQTATFTVAVTNGTPPYGYLYVGLPSGCLTSNGSSLSCTPTGSGTFNVSVRVADSLNKTASATTTLTVTGVTVTPLTVSLSANSTNLPEGSSVTLTASASGGTGPYQYQWTLNGTNTSAGPNYQRWVTSALKPGNYTFGVWVTDTVNTMAPSPTVKVTVRSVAAPPKGGSPPPSSNPLTATVAGVHLYLLLALLIVAILVLVVLLLVRRQRDASQPKSKSRGSSATPAVGASAGPRASVGPSTSTPWPPVAPVVAAAPRTEWDESGEEENARPPSAPSPAASSPSTETPAVEERPAPEPPSPEGPVESPPAEPLPSDAPPVVVERQLGPERSEENPFEGDITPEEINPNVQRIDPRLLQPMEMRVDQDRGTDRRETAGPKPTEADDRARALMERAQQSRKRKAKPSAPSKDGGH